MGDRLQCLSSVRGKTTVDLRAHTDDVSVFFTLPSIPRNRLAAQEVINLLQQKIIIRQAPILDRLLLQFCKITEFHDLGLAEGKIKTGSVPTINNTITREKI